MSGFLTILLVSGLISLGGMSAAFAQEVRGSHVIDIQNGAYQAGAENY